MSSLPSCIFAASKPTTSKLDAIEPYVLAESIARKSLFFRFGTEHRHAPALHLVFHVVKASHAPV